MSHATSSAMRRWFPTLARVSAGLAAVFIMVAAHAQSDLPPGFKAPVPRAAAPAAPVVSSPANPNPANLSPVAAPNPFQAIPSAAAPASPWLEFTFYTPPAIVLVSILAIMLLSLLVSQLAVYRLALKPNVRAGIHPNVVANSVMVWTASMILLATYAVVATFAEGTVGKGYFTALWVVVVLTTLLLTLFRLLIARWAVVLLVVLAVAALMLAFDII